MSALLELAAVGKRHWRGSRAIEVLRDVSFALDAGDFAAVLGDRGMGKTTLLRVAAGIDTPDAGVVSFAGRPVAQMSDAKRAELWRSDLACVWSGTPWPARKVLDTVTVPLLGSGMTRREARRRASEELARWDVGEAAGAHAARAVRRGAAARRVRGGARAQTKSPARRRPDRDAQT